MGNSPNNRQAQNCHHSPDLPSGLMDGWRFLQYLHGVMLHCTAWFMGLSTIPAAAFFCACIVALVLLEKDLPGDPWHLPALQKRRLYSCGIETYLQICSDISDRFCYHVSAYVC